MAKTPRFVASVGFLLAGCGADSTPADPDAAAVDAPTPDASAFDCTGSEPRLWIDGRAATVTAATVSYDGIGCCDGIKAVFDIQGPLGAGYELSLLAFGWNPTTMQTFDLAAATPVTHRKLSPTCGALQCPTVTTTSDFTGWLESTPGAGGGRPFVSLCVHVVDTADAVPNVETVDLYLRDAGQQL